MANVEFGWFEIKSNGRTVNAQGTFTVIMGGKQREPVVSSKRVVGFKSTVRVPGMKGTILDSDSVLVKNDITEMENATITATTRANKTYMVTNAFYTGTGEIELESGGINFEVHGSDFDEARG